MLEAQRSLSERGCESTSLSSAPQLNLNPQPTRPLTILACERAKSKSASPHPCSFPTLHFFTRQSTRRSVCKLGRVEIILLISLARLSSSSSPPFTFFTLFLDTTAALAYPPVCAFASCVCAFSLGLAQVTCLIEILSPRPPIMN